MISRRQATGAAGGSGRRSVAGALVALGVAAVLTGSAMLAASLAPLWRAPQDTATLPVQQQASGPATAPGGAGPTAPSQTGTPNPAILDQPVDGVAFKMAVPALGYTATVHEGTDAAVLETGPGHYPGSAWPGYQGTVGVAAHNVYWLAFGQLQKGADVELQTRRGVFVYEITDIRVTYPADRSIIVPGDSYRIALTTCWPLWAGAYATERLVFLGHEVSGQHFPRRPGLSQS